MVVPARLYARARLSRTLFFHSIIQSLSPSPSLPLSPPSLPPSLFPPPYPLPLYTLLLLLTFPPSFLPYLLSFRAICYDQQLKVKQLTGVEGIDEVSRASEGIRDVQHKIDALRASHPRR